MCNYNLVIGPGVIIYSRVIKSIGGSECIICSQFNGTNGPSGKMGNIKKIIATLVIVICLIGAPTIQCALLKINIGTTRRVTYTLYTM